MKTTTLTFIFTLTIFVSCKDKPTSLHNSDKTQFQDSLYRHYTESSTSPDYFILIYKSDSGQQGQQICLETQDLGYILDKTNLSHRLYFDSDNQPYLIDSADILAKRLKVENYNFSLVDSLTEYLIPSVIDSIRNEMKLKKYDTFWSYSLKYDDYIIHALLRQNIRVYRDDESGFPIPYEK